MSPAGTNIGFDAPLPPPPKFNADELFTDEEYEHLRNIKPDTLEKLKKAFDAMPDIRVQLTGGYEVGRSYYEKPHDGIYTVPDTKRSAVHHLRELGAMVWYACSRRHRGGIKRTPIMDVDTMVERWRAAVVILALAHDKDEADRAEASIEQCLSPLLTAPIKDLRQFAPKLLAVLKADPKVPFLVWRAYERWIELVVQFAPDSEILELKTDLAKQIVALVEEDMKPQLGEAMVRALQWRSAEKLAKVKEVVEAEAVKGNKPRLRGRESCLFMEVGGTEENPAVCVQI